MKMHVSSFYFSIGRNRAFLLASTSPDLSANGERDVPRLTQPTDKIASYSHGHRTNLRAIEYDIIVRTITTIWAHALSGRSAGRGCAMSTKSATVPPSLADCFRPYDTVGGCRAVAAHCSVPNVTPHVKYPCFFSVSPKKRVQLL